MGNLALEQRKRELTVVPECTPSPGADPACPVESHPTERGRAGEAGATATEIFLGFARVVSAALFFLFPDRTHRVIMILLAGGSLTVLFYVWELNAPVPVLGPTFIGGSMLLQQQIPRLGGTEAGACLNR